MPSAPAPRSPAFLAGTLFLAAIALNVWTVIRVQRTEPVEPPAAIPLLTDPADLAAAQKDVIGIYGTGEHSGDRLIVVEPGGIIRFSELGHATSRRDTDTFQIGKVGRTLHLLTRTNGTVQFSGYDTVFYYGDRYMRMKVEPQPTDPSASPSLRRRARSAS